MINILLVDDHRIFRESMGLLLGKEPNLRVVGEASDGCMAIRMAKELEVDLALVDVSLPDLSGVEVARHIAHLPHAPKVLGLSGSDRHGFVDAMLASGASGYLLKSCCFEELVEAIETVVGGRTYVSPALNHHAHGATAGAAARVPPGTLSNREHEVLELIAEGFTTKEIADRLEVSPKTVSTHRTHIMEKLGLTTVAALTRYAVREDLTGHLNPAAGDLVELPAPGGHAASAAMP